MRYLVVFIVMLFSDSVIAQSASSDSLLRAYELRDHFCGLAVLAVDGKEVATKAAGMNDLAQNIQLKPNDKFKIASITKVFTALLIMKLVEERKIELQGTRAGSRYDTPAAYLLLRHRQFTRTQGYETLSNQAVTRFVY